MQTKAFFKLTLFVLSRKGVKRSIECEDAQRQYYEAQVNAIIAKWGVEAQQRYLNDWKDDSFVEAVIKVSNPIKNHFCSECDKKFSTPFNLTRHIPHVHSV